MMKQPTPNVRFAPLTQKHLPDLERFSEEHGKFRYCSCMRWRLDSAAYQRSTKQERVTALAEMVRQNLPVGILAYLDDTPVAWCSIAPRETYAALERYKALGRIDTEPVWSIVCFFVDRKVRGQGVTLGLLKAALEYAVSQGARIIEGYPVQPDARLYTYMGSPATFEKAGFKDVTPVGQTRQIMRYFAETGKRKSRRSGG
jgi:GNAT superfamily N-acetyltransferase